MFKKKAKKPDVLVKELSEHLAKRVEAGDDAEAKVGDVSGLSGRAEELSTRLFETHASLQHDRLAGWFQRAFKP